MKEKIRDILAVLLIIALFVMVLGDGSTMHALLFCGVVELISINWMLRRRLPS
jgi:hypothetical protein